VPVIRWAERIVGRTKAREWILTGKDIGAQEAVNTGLVNKAVPLEELNGAAMEYAELIASKAPLPVRATKKAFLETVNMTAGEASNYIMAKYVPSLWTSEDYKNRIATVYTDVFFKEGKFPPNPKWEGK
jgi:enoyl-CoA hydratase